MHIPSFTIRDVRNIRLATIENVPRVMIITGPNGCGKSTLLQALRPTSGANRPMYIGPHRASRRQRVSLRYLGPEIHMGSVLAGDTLPGYEGIQNINTARTPWDQDDAASYLKFGLCQIELDRREAIASRYDEAREIPKNSVPDVWKPLREMAENLLPHLTFEEIDTSNREEIKCLWGVSNQSRKVDLDDLSSGEKSIIQTFYPLVEHRVRNILDQLKGKEAQSDNDAICVLIDEPELHLHPNLQARILDYFRTLSIRENAQFLIATHSPVIVEHSNSDELYLLRPIELTPAGQNQLIRVATDEEKLQLLRDVFGSTSNITAMRPIVVVEGKREDQRSKRAADARIYAFLSDEFSRVTIRPAGGKSECKKLANSLNNLLRDISNDLKAHALLDRDIDEETPQEPNVHLLPVSMIENLLVDPTVIWKATEVVHHKMSFESEKELETAITEILDELKDDEISRRIKSQFGLRIFRLKSPVESAGVQLGKFLSKISEELSEDNLAKMRCRSISKVDAIIGNISRREFFHGKEILDRFYNAHMHDTGMSKEIFLYECAKFAKDRKSVQDFVNDLMAMVGLSSVDAQTE